MHYLGVPTTRALSLVATGEAVVRDMFYDGNPRPSRARSSAASRRRSCASATSRSSPRSGELDVLKRLADYVISQHFPELGRAVGRDLRALVRRDLPAHRAR